MSNNILKVSKGILRGKVRVSGAKNAALKLLTASVLTDGKVELFDSPNGLLDMKIHIGMLEKMGKSCFQKDGYLCIEEDKELLNELLWDERSIRNSLLILGSLTTRFGEGKVPLPGGCPLGDRKYDLHVKILESMGAKVWEEEGYLCTKASKRLIGCDIHLPIRSTGATENAILCGVLAEGNTRIWNPHIRPEVLDLIEMLNKMGGKIKVFGQRSIEISGVKKLNGVRHRVVPDNMEAVTWAIASAITGGDVEILNFPFEHLEVPLIFLRESGMKLYKGEDSLIVRGSTPYPIEISTGPYPGINSDMQPLFAVYGACSEGDSKIVDLRFPGRYGYVEELAKMGVKYKIEGDLLKISGGNKLNGAKVKAVDLRAGMALLLAGLIAEGETVIEDAWQIYRGYENLDEKLKVLLSSN
ncbi:UDP-N-acetylglucosamine 1-carboxyvinyltransferase [Psychrobacter piscatorii]|uniref:UDP-N-acetylglucosamine 1-carboxyvinyltransferase n=1 Tax=Psychrobacter piscatorii TaxID=554343 RepID=A0A0T6DSP4_9GAMM|nr:UDP-N-acetylglucosamine 1-carboxyvinyltransferase [Psychrobacter piscatorii]KRU22869.1 UDP-N-acetylglucosamine 1-carboxyvinyltransferase [Psychrobacter piscatorii]